MADNFQVDYELNAAQAREELEKVRKALNGITADFNHQIETSKKGVEELTKVLTQMINTTTAGTGQRARAERGATSILGSYYSRASQGTTTSSAQDNQVTRAATQAIINDLQSTAKAAQSSITDAIVKQTLSFLKTTEIAVEARIKSATFSQGQATANTNDRYLAARATLADQRRADTIYAAENGRNALASKNRLEAINNNGGADLMGIQGRVMVNYAAVGGLFTAAKSAASGILELDKELHQFQAISAATNSEMVGFKSNLTEITRSVPFTTLEITKAATSLAQAGLSVKQVTESLGAISKFATATGSSLEQAVDVVTSTLTAFNLETSRTGDVANIFTTALNLSKLSVDKLITSLNYIGPTAEAMGLTLEETTAILGALSQSGVRASTMGTGFRALLTDLQAPSKKLTAALKAAGLSIEDIDVKTKGFLPVIETLKNSGFGAAEAYATLETRSAAAFLALANNTKLAYDMQKSFSLSNAAIQANNTQMMSLSNSAKNLSSVLTASLFTAFDPIVEMLARVTTGVTNVAAHLGDFPNVLKVVGVAATALGTVMAASLGVSLLKSLTIMIPVLGTIGSGFIKLSGAIAGATTVGEGFAAVLALINKISMGGWIGIIATAAIAAAAAFYAWSGSSDKLAVSIDKLESRVNELKGAADETSGKINSIDTAIQGLIDRRAELDGNELMRGAKIDELKNQFHELGLSIKDDTTSVTDLIARLHDLKQESAKVRAAELGESIAVSKQEVAALQEQQKQLTDRNGNTAVTVQSLAAATVGHKDGEQTARPYLAREIGKQLGPDIAEAVRIGLGDLSSLGTGADAAYRARALQANIGAKIAGLSLHPTDQSETQIQFLMQLRDTIAPLIDNITKLAAVQADIAVRQDQEQSANVQGSRSYKQLALATDDIRKTAGDKVAAISGDKNMTSDDKLAALQSVQDWLKKATDDAVLQFQKSFAQDQGNNAALQGVDAASAASTAKQGLADIYLSLNEEAMKVATTVAKQTQQVLKKTQTANSKKLADWERQISGAKNNDAFETAKKGYDDFLKSSSNQILAFYDQLIKMAEDAKDPDEVKRLAEERQAYSEDLDDKIAERQRDNAKKANDLLKDSLQRQRAAIQDNAQALQTQIDDATAQLKKTSPGDAFNQLKEKIQGLITALGGEFDKISNIDVRVNSINQNGLDLGTPMSAATAGSGLDAVRHFMGRGLSKAGAAAIAGNIANESGFNPDVVGDKGTAHGVAQWRGTRWNELRSFAIGQGKPTNDVSTQYDFVLKELQRDYPQLFKRLQDPTEDPQVLAKDFMNIFERPNADPKINHVAKRQADAESFYAGADTSGDAKITKKNDDLNRTAQEQNDKFVAAQSDAVISNLKSRLGNLKTQVRFTDDPKSFADLQQSVQDTYNQLIEQEGKKFEAANSDLKDSNPTEYDNKRKALIDGLRENMNSDLQKVLEAYYKAADEELNKPIDLAKAKLSAAQDPANVNKFTASDIQNLQQDVALKEREAAVQRILLIEQEIAAVRQKGAEAEANNTDGSRDSEVLQWRTLENDLIEKNNKLKAENKAWDDAKVQQAPSVSNSIQSATNAWAQQNGIVDSHNKLIPLAKQVENAWGPVLDGLSSGFTTFFTNIASGTMTAGQAFKQLGQTILQMFMQIIAKALANQIIMSLFGGGGGGEGFLGSLGQGLFGVVGKATGGMIRAANGAVAPFRDGGMYQLMPGEMVMRQSAVQAIGEDKLTEMNNLGNRQVSQGALNGRVSSNDNKQQQSGVVNVWVVSPDQVPQSGPNDIIATVAQNIQNRGTIKQLIQQVQMGTV